MKRLRDLIRWPGGNDCDLRTWIDVAIVVAFVCWLSLKVGGWTA